MPWSTENTPDQVKNLPQGAVKVWIAVANQGLEDGKSEEDAIKAAWGAVKQQWKQDEGGRWVRLADLETVEITDTEILATGTWRAATGPVTISQEDLENIVAAFNELKDDESLNYDAPIKLGHSKDQKLLQADGYPAGGWVTALKIAGNKLLADISSVPAKLGDVIKAGGYKKVSSELMADFKAANGKTYPMVLRAVALLGQDIPAVKTIKDIVAAYSEGDAGTEIIVLYSQGQAPDGIDAELQEGSGADIGNQKSKQESKNMEMTIEEIRAKLNLTESDDITAKLDELMTKAEKSAEVDLAEYDAMKTRVDELAEKIRIKDRDTLVDQAFSDGKLVPAMREWALSEAYEHPESFRKYLENAPKVVDLKEHGSAGQKGGPKIGENGEVDLSEIELTEEEIAVANRIGQSLDEVRKVKAGVNTNDSFISG